MSVELSIALLFSSKTIPSASSLKYVLYRWVTFLLKYGKLHQPLGGGVAFPTFQQDAEFNWDFIVSNVTKEG